MRVSRVKPNYDHLRESKNNCHMEIAVIKRVAENKSMLMVAINKNIYLLI